MSSGIRSLPLRSQPSLVGLLPGCMLAGLAVSAGAWYSLKNIGAPPDAYVFGSLFFSLNIAFLSTFFSLILGTGLALWLWNQNSWLPSQLYTIPLILPHIVAAFFVVIFFSQSGILSSLLYHLRIIKDLQDFPVLVFDNGGTGIILAYVYKETAFVSLLVLASLRKIPAALIQTSFMLGASRMRTARKVILPHISPTLWIVGIIIFLYSFGAYDIPYLIGSGSRPMVSIEAYRLFFEGSIAQRPMAHTLLFIVWVISLAFLIVFILIRTLFSRRSDQEHSL
ncbi:MAG: ABC transporter permease [Salinispira sp.]